MVAGGRMKMRIESAELFFLQIPLKLIISHGGRANRAFSDSLVLKVSASDGTEGYGEAIVREYVSGSPMEGGDPRQKAAMSAARLLAPLRGRSFHWHEILRHFAEANCEDHELPLLCAAETALLDIACKEEGKDIYSLIGLNPVRQTIRYGGTLPMVPLESADTYIGMCFRIGFPNVKVKLGADPAYNDAILSLCRKVFGEKFDLRVDANASWRPEDAEVHLNACARHGVALIEQPFSAAAAGWEPVAARARSRGFSFMADEGFCTAADISAIGSGGVFGMVNLRLSKNGGLLHVLSLAREAERNGLKYQLGCMVGETGILSALGRVAASLLPHPLYLEGGYDEVLLSGNITTESCGFGSGGEASIVRGRRIGFEIHERKLARFTAARMPLPEQ
jgi:muconate cycloisomerase